MPVMQALSRHHATWPAVDRAIRAAALPVPFALAQLSRTSGAHDGSVMLRCFLYDAMLNTDLNALSSGKPDPGPIEAPMRCSGKLDVSTFIHHRAFLTNELRF